MPLLAFGLNLRELTGAIMLGITVLIFDCGFLWLRTQVLSRIGTSIKWTMILGGFFLRIVNIAFFLFVGARLLVPSVQPVFHWILVTIPIWNLLGAIRLSDQP